jgi:uncharacterized protein (TIGR02145 family)
VITINQGSLKHLIINMKRVYGFWFYSLFVIGFIFILTNSCEKEKPVTLPELSTAPLTDITSKSFNSGGIVTSDGGATITARGICWGTDLNPDIFNNVTTDGTGSGSFKSSITGLTSGTNYYVRAYATNSLGTAYGNSILFITPLTDIDGNVYNTIMIGSQVWMTANLKTTRYSDSTKIPCVTDNAEWNTLSAPAYCWYNNNETVYKNIYGAFYNWFTVNTGKLCPDGWHVPSEADWTLLTDCLGGEYRTGGKLKESGINHWNYPNEGASNDFGFTALPGGYRSGLTSGSFRAMGYIGWWWASTESDLTWARNRTIAYDVSEIAKGKGLKKNGYSVRCVKN